MTGLFLLAASNFTFVFPVLLYIVKLNFYDLSESIRGKAMPTLIVTAVSIRSGTGVPPVTRAINEDLDSKFTDISSKVRAIQYLNKGRFFKHMDIKFHWRIKY